MSPCKLLCESLATKVGLHRSHTKLTGKCSFNFFGLWSSYNLQFERHSSRSGDAVLIKTAPYHSQIFCFH
ncbi:Hypothetical predicted protein [Octopus vulgaris]|uniref:Uncharacterized protein n=1 Tax=Octopus vulgaris TaxID=6645 RepID=A0AA36BK79_OCTVU|nr:Hypothetical predicted protein [Octopus vulgaris]